MLRNTLQLQKDYIISGCLVYITPNGWEFNPRAIPFNKSVSVKRGPEFVLDLPT